MNVYMFSENGDSAPVYYQMSCDKKEAVSLWRDFWGNYNPCDFEEFCAGNHVYCEQILVIKCD